MRVILHGTWHGHTLFLNPGKRLGPLVPQKFSKSQLYSLFVPYISTFKKCCQPRGGGWDGGLRQTHRHAQTRTRTSTRAHTHTNTHTHTHTHSHSRTRAHTQTNTQTNTHTNTHKHTHARAHAHTNAHTLFLSRTERGRE